MTEPSKFATGGYLTGYDGTSDCVPFHFQGCTNGMPPRAFHDSVVAKSRELLRLMNEEEESK